MDLEDVGERLGMPIDVAACSRNRGSQQCLDPHHPHKRRGSVVILAKTARQVAEAHFTYFACR